MGYCCETIVEEAIQELELNDARHYPNPVKSLLVSP